jgi:hypothetical protein
VDAVQRTTTASALKGPRNLAALWVQQSEEQLQKAKALVDTLNNVSDSEWETEQY